MGYVVVSTLHWLPAQHIIDLLQFDQTTLNLLHLGNSGRCEAGASE